MEETGFGFWLLRIAASIAGVLLIYAAVFTYPEEREGLHNRLEDWWLQLHEASDIALKRHMAFIQKTAATAKSGFDWLFGPPLSTRFCLVSGFLSMGTFAVGMLSFGDYGWAVPTGIALFSIGVFVIALLIGRQQDQITKEIRATELEMLDKYTEIRLEPPTPNLGKSGLSKNNRLAQSTKHLTNLEQLAGLRNPLAPGLTFQEQKPWWAEAFSSEKTSSFVTSIVLATLAFSSTGLVFAGAQEKGVDEGVFMLALMTAFICDAVCVLITVYFLEKISKARSAVSAAAFFLIDAVVAGAMLAVPWMLFIWIAERETTLAHYLIFVAAANLSTLVPSVVFLLVAITALAHLLFWPFLLRPFYNLIHAEKITKPKTLGIAGLACFSIWLDVPEGYQSFFKNLMSLF